MSQEQELSKEELITFLQKHNITYIYNPVYESIFGNDYLGWIESNTDHMLYLFDKYHRKLQGLTYTMIIKINEIEKYISKDYKSIINYFKENPKEFANYKIYKTVDIKYELDM